MESTVQKKQTHAPGRKKRQQVWEDASDVQTTRFGAPPLA